MALNFLNNGYFAAKVGIGTESPSYQLTLGGNAVGSTEGLRIDDPSNAAYGAHFSFSDTPNEIWIGGITNNTYNSAIGIHREATRSVTIDVNNNVGIGTTSPTQKLDVNGDVSAYQARLAYGARFTGGSTDFLLYNNPLENSLFMRDITNSNMITTWNTTNFQVNEDLLVNGAVQFSSYTAGTLVTDASGNITVSSGGGAGGPYLPLAGGVMTGNVKRSSAIVGFLEGSYNNVGANGLNTNPIYTIGSSYNPASTTLSNMYGIGYCNASASFITLAGATSWGMYVAGDGDARVWLDGNNGNISHAGDLYVGGGDIVLAGTGRIQGVDTVSATTDAANKAYVDAHGGGLGPFLPLAGGTMSGAISFGSSNANVNLSRGSFITFYEDGNSSHGIGSRNSSGVESDDIRINSYGAVYINLDSNNNNSSGADFVIGNHGSATGTISQFFKVSGETGNVGIGTTSPNTKLEVDGAISTTTSDYVQGTTGSRLLLETSGSGNTHSYIQAQNTGGTSSAEDLALQLYGGNVGIGTDSPDKKLHLHEPSSLANYIRITNDTSTLTGGALIGLDSAENLRINQQGSKQIRFFTDGITRLDIESSGDVIIYESLGIGTTSPATKLDVAGTYRQINPAAGAAGGTVIARTLTYTVSPYGLVTRAYANGLFTIQCERESNAGETFDFALQPTGGNLGIGTTSPSQKLHVSGSARVTGAYYDSSNSAGTASKVLSSTGTGTEWVKNAPMSTPTGEPTGSDTINNIVSLTQAEYDAGTPVSDTLYIIT